MATLTSLDGWFPLVECLSKAFKRITPFAFSMSDAFQPLHSFPSTFDGLSMAFENGITVQVGKGMRQQRKILKNCHNCHERLYRGMPERSIKQSHVFCSLKKCLPFTLSSRHPTRFLHVILLVFFTSSYSFSYDDIILHCGLH